MYEKVLAPIDDTRVAESVLPYAEELAGGLDSEVTLLYVCESEDERHRRTHEFYLGIVADGVKNDIRERYPGKKHGHIKVDPVVSVGKPPEEIINYADTHGISLIIIATHPHHGLMHHSMGHTADKVLHTASMPILLVTTTKPQPGPSPRRLLDRILVPLDGTERGEAVLPYIAEFVKKSWAQVTLLQIIAPEQPVHTIGGLDHVRFTEQQIDAMKERARQYLENVGQTFADTKAFVNCEVRVGDTVKEIINLTNETNSRLVAISVQRYPGIKQWVSGGIVQKVLQSTSTPVLLVRAPG